MLSNSEKRVEKMNQKEKDEYWMKKALAEAEKAMSQGEHPIGCVIVAGNTELTRGQTSVARQESITAHGELLALKSAGWKVFSAKRPLTIYTTLEPCLMCVGAAMQCGVDEIVFAMPAVPDGGTKHLKAIQKNGDKVPKIRSGVLINEAINLMKKDLVKNPNHPGLNYAKALLKGLEKL